jgi:8-oxo-dGTP diphosphatase
LKVIHQYPDFELTMHSFICEVESQELTLKEHIDQKWLKINELYALDWAAADIPIVDKLVSNE